MGDNLTFATLSKYPPYRSGHAQQAVWNNKALAEITGRIQHQIAYTGRSDDPLDDAGERVLVHRLADSNRNSRAADGHLVKEMSAELTRVAEHHDVDIFLTYYSDPHANAANRAADAVALRGRRPLVVHSIEGSDVLNSICDHIEDGQAAVLVADCLRADVLCAVSRFTADEFIRAVAQLYGDEAAATTTDRIELRYPGLPPSSFTVPHIDVTAAHLQALGLDVSRPVVSSIGRLAPEKGCALMADVAELALADGAEFQFVIAGSGTADPHLLARVMSLPNLFLFKDLSSTTLHSLRSGSTVGMLPTRAVPGFVETFCISALEYAALGVPVLATRLGGVPEAVPGSEFLIDSGAPPAEWWSRLQSLVIHRESLSVLARAFAGDFDSKTSALRIIELAKIAAASRIAM